jgi:hypothetical protein
MRDVRPSQLRHKGVSILRPNTTPAGTALRAGLR